jgi:hypothetical protein
MSSGTTPGPNKRRRLPIQRSAIAFARGVCGGVWMMLIPSSWKTPSKARELSVAIADQEPELLGAVGEVHQLAAGLLGHPIAAGMGGEPGDVHAAVACSLTIRT